MGVFPALIEYHSKDIQYLMQVRVGWLCLLSGKTHAFRAESCHKHKRSKGRIIVLVYANMDGSWKMPLLIIGKSEKPRCFKHVKSCHIVRDITVVLVWLIHYSCSSWHVWEGEWQPETRKYCCLYTSVHHHFVSGIPDVSEPVIGNLWDCKILLHICLKGK
jgi:hypothetical protein